MEPCNLSWKWLGFEPLTLAVLGFTHDQNHMEGGEQCLVDSETLCWAMSLSINPGITTHS